MSVIRQPGGCSPGHRTPSGSLSQHHPIGCSLEAGLWPTDRQSSSEVMRSGVAIIEAVLESAGLLPTTFPKGPEVGICVDS